METALRAAEDLLVRLPALFSGTLCKYDCYAASLQSNRQRAARPNRIPIILARAVARAQCPLWVKSRHFATTLRMSAFGGKADVIHQAWKCPLIAKSGH